MLLFGYVCVALGWALRVFLIWSKISLLDARL